MTRMAEPVVGYRLWVAQPEGLCAFDSTPWPVGDLHAACRTTREHQAPEPGCACGAYGLHQVPAVIPAGMALGAIVAWGRLEVHAHGFRAEHVRPIALASRGR